VDYVQIREKDLEADDLAALAAEIVRTVRDTGGLTRVLLNGPVEIATEAGCDGIHLPSGLPENAIDDARTALSKVKAHPVISVSCHTIAEVALARDHGATLALYAPVFEKRLEAETAPGLGLVALSAACCEAAQMPVFALGGVTAENAKQCVEAGAAGIAAIRLFASDHWRSLR
jgi:thiamine-phosphate pyrophosphorylase